MKPICSAEDIANYLLFKAYDEAERKREHLSNLKLQKLLYYAQGIHLVMHNSPLFPDAIVARQYGPVIPRLYAKYREHGSDNIPGPDAYFSPDTFDDETIKFLDGIYEFFGSYSAIGLMRMAHADDCYRDAGLNNEITQESMKRAHRKYLKKE